MTLEELKQQSPIIMKSTDLYDRRKDAVVAQAEFFKTHKFIFYTLTAHEVEVLTLRYGVRDGKILTMKEVAEKLNCSSPNVYEIEAGAFRRLRHPLRVNLLLKYTDETFTEDVLDETFINFKSLIKKDILDTIGDDSLKVVKDVKIEDLKINFALNGKHVFNLKRKLINGGITTCADLIEFLQNNGNLKNLCLGSVACESVIMSICDLIEKGDLHIDSKEKEQTYLRHKQTYNKRQEKNQSYQDEIIQRAEQNEKLKQQEIENCLANAKNQPQNVMIEYLDLSTRSYRALKNIGINTLADLIENKQKFKEAWSIGEKSIQEILNRVKSLGFDLEKEIIEEREERLRNVIKYPQNVLIEDLQLSNRALHHLKSVNIRTLADMIEFYHKYNGSFMLIKNLGTKSEKEILDKLFEFDIDRISDTLGL